MKLREMTNEDRENYFIRLTTEENTYLHPEGKNYRCKVGLVGAAVFSKKMAEGLIGELPYKNLEAVKVKEVLK